MGKIYTKEELNGFDRESLISLLLTLQEQTERLNRNMERIIEQIALANNRRFGRSSEKSSVVEEQPTIFDFLDDVINEAEYMTENLFEPEPEIDDICNNKPKKQKGKREADLKGLPVEVISHSLSQEELSKIFGGRYKELPEEIYKRLKFTPATYTVEEHHVHVYAGVDNQTIVRADRPKDLLRNSIATPSLVAAIMNAKYVNAIPLYRIEQEQKRNGVKLLRQITANWIIRCSERYLSLLYDRLHLELYRFHVLQADETPVEVTKDGRHAGSKSYMWVYRTGKAYTETPIVLYEYQKTRNGDHPKEFLKGFTGVVVCDGFSGYHKLERENEDILFAGCWAHARRRFANVLKVIKDKSALRNTVAYEAIRQIKAIYKLDKGLWELEPEQRLKQRQLIIRPLVSG
jgi:transposase